MLCSNKCESFYWICSLLFFKEPLIDSGASGLWNEVDQIKAPVAANSQSITKIGNAKMGNFSRKATFHESIRGSLIIAIK